MRAYKGFNNDMTCRGFQYQEGGTYKTDKVEICECGFHACELPVDAFRYYVPGKSKFHVVDLSGEIEYSLNKVAATEITVGEQISPRDMIDISISELEDNATAHGMYAVISSEEDYAEVAASRHHSVACATGDGDTCMCGECLSVSATTAPGSMSVCSGSVSCAVTTGFDSRSYTIGGASVSVATNKAYASALGQLSVSVCTMGSIGDVHGNNSVAVATRNSCADVENESSIAVCLDLGSCVKGVLGAHIVAADYSDKRGNFGEFLGYKLGKIDGIELMPDTWYYARNGEWIKGFPLYHAQ